MKNFFKKAKWIGALGLSGAILAPLGVFFPALGAFNPASLVGVATVTTLNAANYIPYPYVYLVGYSSFGDGGAGVLAYNSGSAAAADHCQIFHDAAGHVFQRLDTGAQLNIDQCGAKGNGTTNDSAAVGYAVAASRHVVCSAGKTYLMGAQVTISTANTTIDGNGCNFNPDNHLETISSGTYNSGTGVVTLMMSAPIDFGVGEPIVINSLTGTGAFASLDGSFTTISGTTGSTVVYNGGTGHGAATITGGNLVVGGTVFDIEASGFTGQNLSFRATNGGLPILIGNTSSISNVEFTHLTCDGSNVPSPPMSDCVHVGNVDNLKIRGFTSITSGYGVLSLAGDHQHGVSISDVYCADMYADCIAENGITHGDTTDWTVAHAIYAGAHGYPALATEERFASFSGADGINMSDVIASNANGDSCIHFESGADHINMSNISLTGCLGQFIEYNSSHDNIIAVNVQCNYTAAGQGAACFTGVNNSYSNELNLTNINCVDSSGTNAFNCHNLIGHIGTTTITGGGGTGLHDFAQVGGSTQDVSITGVHVYTVNGVFDESAASTGGVIQNLTFNGNYIYCTNWCIFTEANTALTSYPTNITVTGNHFDGTTGSKGVAIANGVDVFGTGNWYRSTFTDNSVAEVPHTIAANSNDWIQGTGLRP